MPMTSHKERLKCAISNTPGTAGSLTASTASSGFVGFAAADDGKTFDLLLLDGTAWEVRTGCVYTHSTTSLSRGTLVASSTGSAIALTASTVVTDTLTAAMLNLLEQQLDRGFTEVRNTASNQQSIAAGGNTKVGAALNNVVANPYSYWDATNKRFQPSRPGWYHCFMSVQCTTGANPGVVSQANLRKNSAAELGGPVFPALTDFAAQAAGPIYFNGTTDFVEVYVYNAGPSAASTSSTAGEVVFKAYYLSAK